MTHRTHLAIGGAVLALLSGTTDRADAQARSRRPAPKPAATPNTTPALRPVPPVEVPPSIMSGASVIRANMRSLQLTPHHVSVESYVTSRYDDNVNRDPIGITSMGIISGGTVRYASADLRPLLQVELDAAIHRYSATTRFNRISQRGRVTLSRRIDRDVTVALLTEGSLGGSGEDRDVADQIFLLPQLDFRLSSAKRLRVAGAQRWRRFPTDSLQHAINRYALAELRHRWSGGSELELEGRIEANAARGDRFDFTRTTTALTYGFPLGPHVQVEAGMQYRRQRYSGRFTTVNGQRVVRIDHRLQPGAEVRARLGATEVLLSYDPEWRRSNDPDKNIAQTLWQLGVRRRWY